LTNKSNFPPEIIHVNALNISTIDLDGSLLGVIETQKELHDCALPAARFTNECAYFPSFEQNIEVFKDRLILFIVEADVLKANAFDVSYLSPIVRFNQSFLSV